MLALALEIMLSAGSPAPDPRLTFVYARQDPVSYIFSCLGEAPSVDALAPLPARAAAPIDPHREPHATVADGECHASPRSRAGRFLKLQQNRLREEEIVEEIELMVLS